MNEKFALHKSYIKFAEEKTQQAYEEFLCKFFKFAEESGDVPVLVKYYNKGQMHYARHAYVNTTQGHYLGICTDPDECAKAPINETLVMGLDFLIEVMLEDDRVKGICVNPYGDFPCFIPQEHVQQLYDRKSINPES